MSTVRAGSMFIRDHVYLWLNITNPQKRSTSMEKNLTLLALDYSPSDRPDCHKNSLRFTKIKFQEKIAFERHAEQRERSAQKNKKYIYLVGSFTISAQGA